MCFIIKFNSTKFNTFCCGRPYLFEYVKLLQHKTIPWVNEWFEFQNELRKPWPQNYFCENYILYRCIWIVKESKKSSKKYFEFKLFTYKKNLAIKLTLVITNKLVNQKKIKIYSPPNWNCKIKHCQHFRPYVTNKQVTDYCWGYRGITCFSNSNQGSK